MGHDRLRKRSYIVSSIVALVIAITLISLITIRAIHADNGDPFMLVALPTLLWVGVAFVARLLWRGYCQLKE